MKLAWSFAAIVAALAGPALAQTTPAPAGASPVEATPGSTVSGITVKPLPRKPCAPKDADCIAMVMAEVKDLYPEQLKKFCYQQKIDVARQDMQANIAGWCSGPAQGASALCTHTVSPVVKKVCTPEPPTTKQ